jgi:hypothetical protein
MFAILLLVLTLLSTLGGSILPKKELFNVDEEEEQGAATDMMAAPSVDGMPPTEPVAPAMEGVPEPFTQDDQEEFAAF